MFSMREIFGSFGLIALKRSKYVLASGPLPFSLAARARPANAMTFTGSARRTCCHVCSAMSMRPRTSKVCALSSNVWVADSVVCARIATGTDVQIRAPNRMAAAKGRIDATLFIRSPFGCTMLGEQRRHLCRPSEAYRFFTDLYRFILVFTVLLLPDSAIIATTSTSPAACRRDQSDSAVRTILWQREQGSDHNNLPLDHRGRWKSLW